MVSAVNLQNIDSLGRGFFGHIMIIDGKTPPSMCARSLEDLGLHASQESQMTINLHAFIAVFLLTLDIMRADHLCSCCQEFPAMMGNNLEL